MILKTILFLLVNFGALALGALFTGEGVPSDWYSNLNKAPWTPPGWLFGAAWTSIMILFSVYMALLWKKVVNKKVLLGIFTLQFVLNVAWNPIFFHFNQAALGLLVIVMLTVLVWFFFFRFVGQLRWKSALILPYGIWLLIATSLNAYILLMN